MGLVRNFHGAQPGPRDDDQPYLTVEFWEAPDVSGSPGSFVLIDTQDLDPVDTDPANPISRNLTTEEATLDTAWYRLVFLDADGDEDRTAPVAWPPEEAALPGGLDLDEFKARIDFDPGITIQDGLLIDFLVAAFEQAGKPAPDGTGRRLTPTPSSDSDPPVDLPAVISYGRFIRVPDARALTGVKVGDDTLTSDSYDTLEQDGLIVQIELDPADGRWSTRERRKIVLTGRFGYATLPQGLKEAIYVLAARWWYEREAQYADQVAIAEGQAIQSYYRQLPPRVRAVFSTYRLPAGLGGLP